MGFASPPDIKVKCNDESPNAPEAHRPSPRLLLPVLLCTLGDPLAYAAPVQHAPSAQGLLGPLPPNLESLQITPNRIPTNKKTLITATLNIPYAVKPASVALRQLDNTGNNPTATLAVFHDDGLQGDNVAGDGLYTSQATLLRNSAGTVYLDGARPASRTATTSKP